MRIEKVAKATVSETTAVKATGCDTVEQATPITPNAAILMALTRSWLHKKSTIASTQVRGLGSSHPTTSKS